MRQREIDADECDISGEFFPLVVLDGFSVLQDLGYGRDERNEGDKGFLEFRNISDIEENIELSLLWKAAPA